MWSFFHPLLDNPQDKRDDPRLDDNYLFYANEIESIPEGDTIENIHKYWWGNYDRLEYHHGFIQWYAVGGV